MGINYSSSTGYATPRLDLGVAFQEFEAEEGLFIADQVLPDFSSKRREATFSVRPRASLLQNVDTKRGARGKFNRIDSKAEDKSFACKTYGLEAVVDDEERELYASDFDAEMAALTDVLMALRIAREIRVASMVQNTTTWTGSDLYTDVSATAPFDNPSSSVVDVVIDAKEKVRRSSGMRANALILSEVQANNLLKNTQIRSQFPGAALITLDMIKGALAAIFGLRYLVVGGAVYDAAGEDASAETITDIWSDDYAMVCRLGQSGDALSSPSLGRTVRWSGFDVALAVQTYREEQTMGDVLRAFESIDELVIDSAQGHLLKVD